MADISIELIMHQAFTVLKLCTESNLFNVHNNFIAVYFTKEKNYNREMSYIFQGHTASNCGARS